MSEKKFICLDRFERHSCYPWWWDADNKKYEQECSLMGCPYVEKVEKLNPVGEIAFIGVAGCPDHDWDHWMCAGDQVGTYTPPFLYKRECRLCGGKHMAENLEKES